ncbi:NADH-dependent flavin oxidoreductase [Neonectria magnoliae]|uniref:NADH-dependent flavin oxidoreductase n=1 Tax=Neonectria magnoliae TaxID=2732573 RepID=A0ABR1HPI6_9HYPO
MAADSMQRLTDLVQGECYNEKALASKTTQTPKSETPSNAGAEGKPGPGLFHSPWHITHYGWLAQRGRSHHTGGLGHVPYSKKHVDFAHGQNCLIGIQLAHAGRKASTLAPWLNPGGTASEEAGGWPEDIIGPTGERHNDSYANPRAMILAEIEGIKQDFVMEARRAVRDAALELR